MIKIHNRLQQAFILTGHYKMCANLSENTFFKQQTDRSAKKTMIGMKICVLSVCKAILTESVHIVCSI